MSKQRCTKAQVIAALRETKGTQYLAAKRLGVSAKTVQRYLDRYPDIRDIIDESRQELTDTSELKLWQAVQDGNLRAIFFVLRTQGKKRGYVERRELEHSGQLDVHVDASDEDRRKIMRAALAELGLQLGGEDTPEQADGDRSSPGGAGPAVPGPGP